MRQLIVSVREVLGQQHDPKQSLTLIKDAVGEAFPRLASLPVVTNPPAGGRYLLFKDRDYGFVMMLMVWQPQQRTPIHNHATWGVELVLKNQIRVVDYDVIDDKPRYRDEGVHGEGAVLHVLPPNEDYHRVEHHKGQPAISLHLYGSEIVQCMTYVEDTGFSICDLQADFLDCGCDIEEFNCVGPWLSIVSPLIFLTLATLAAVGKAEAHPFAKELKRQKMLEPVPANLDTSRKLRGEFFQVSYKLADHRQDIPLSAHHGWMLTVKPLAQQTHGPVAVEVLGDMPRHGHGLPTVPQVKNIGHGVFQVSGLMFHMAGWWVVDVRVKQGKVSETLRFNLLL